MKLKVGQRFAPGSRPGKDSQFQITSIGTKYLWAVAVKDGKPLKPGHPDFFQFRYSVAGLTRWLEGEAQRTAKDAERKKKKEHFAKKLKKPGKTAPPKKFTVGATKLALVDFSPTLSAHKLPAVQSAISQCVTTAKKTWKWAPKVIVVKFRILPKGVMGQAVHPANLPSQHRRKQPGMIMFLSHELMSEYGLKTVKRTALHELAHLATPDKHPIPRENKRRFGGHDDDFCALLKKVDKLVTDYRTCRFFND